MKQFIPLPSVTFYSIAREVRVEFVVDLILLAHSFNQYPYYLMYRPGMDSGSVRDRSSPEISPYPRGWRGGGAEWCGRPRPQSPRGGRMVSTLCIFSMNENIFCTEELNYLTKLKGNAVSSWNVLKLMIYARGGRCVYWPPAARQPSYATATAPHIRIAVSS